MEKKYSEKTLSSIKEREYMIQEEGLQILVKPIPETDEPGVLDPRLFETIVPMVTGLKSVVIGMSMKQHNRKKKNLIKSAMAFRKSANVSSIPIVESVDVKPGDVPNENVHVPIRIYTPKQKKPGLQPVFYYIHGGGFIAGNMDVTDEKCKLIVEKTGCVAVQPDYRLAPEYPFPAGLDDCYAVLKWIYANAKDFGGNPEMICISGDSSGANLATVCAMRDRDENTNMVKVQALQYPTVDLAHFVENSKASRSAYEIAEKQKKVMNSLFDMLSDFLGKHQHIMGEYLGVDDDSAPYISPLLADLKGMPPAIILLSEYDFMRAENELYARKLKDAGVEVKYIRYRGLIHGFADQIGVTPQAEDAIDEIGSFMMGHFTYKL